MFCTAVMAKYLLAQRSNPVSLQMAEAYASSSRVLVWIDDNGPRISLAAAYPSNRQIANPSMPWLTTHYIRHGTNAAPLRPAIANLACYKIYVTSPDVTRQTSPQNRLTHVRSPNRRLTRPCIAFRNNGPANWANWGPCQIMSGKLSGKLEKGSHSLLISFRGLFLASRRGATKKEKINHWQAKQPRGVTRFSALA